MEETAAKLITQVPYVGGMIVCMWMFLKFGERAHQTYLQSNTAQSLLVAEMHKEHMDARAQSREIIKENTVAQIASARAIDAALRVIESRGRTA
jgi:hypothetical protein